MDEKKWSSEGIISSLLLLSILLTILIQVFTRLIPSINLVWTEELSRWLWVWLVCLAFGEIERTNGHLRMSFIEQKIPEKLLKTLHIIFDITFLVVLTHLLIIGERQVVKSLRATAVTLPLTRGILYLSLPVGLIFVFIRIVIRVYRNLKNALAWNKSNRE